MSGFDRNTDDMTLSETSTTHDRTDPRFILDRAIETGTAVIDAVRADQLVGPTPCDGMDVRAMLGHLVGVVDRIAALGRSEDPFAVVESRAPDDDWVNAWAVAADHAVGAWSDDAVLEEPMALPWIQGSGADILASYFSELTVHTWDLATAIGRRPDWDEAVVAAALAARDFLPAENRLALYAEIAASMGVDEVAVPFAEAITVPEDAPAIDHLVAWTGRDPSGLDA